VVKLNTISPQVVKYNPNAEWDGTKYTTGSLYAYYLLAQQHGYE
jgi:hypothetical protein